MPGSLGHVTADGSPVAVFLALPPGEAPRLIHGAVRPGGSILELGCGAGRITRPLVAMGHPVVAVDNSSEMLEHITGAERVCTDIFTLELNRTFDAVVAGSYLVNTPDPTRRRDLLRTCRRHVKADGVVLVQRHDPEWAVEPADTDGAAGPVDVSFRLVEHRGREFDAAVTYRVGSTTWTTSFTAAIVRDADLGEDAAACGLLFDRRLDETGTWIRLHPAARAHHAEGSGD